MEVKKMVQNLKIINDNERKISEIEIFECKEYNDVESFVLNFSVADITMIWFEVYDL